MPNYRAGDRKPGANKHMHTMPATRDRNTCARVHNERVSDWDQGGGGGHGRHGRNVALNYYSYLITNLAGVSVVVAGIMGCLGACARQQAPFCSNIHTHTATHRCAAGRRVDALILGELKRLPDTSNY